MEDTIAAIATPPGEGGIGIVRISGEKAEEILDLVFRPFGGEQEAGPRKLRYGHVVDDDGNVIDEVLAVLMKAPHTYTGEDVAEIDCHGGIVPLRKTLSLVYSKGARPAERGEFTKRAFLNGRIDLSQAEAVMDVVKAKADKSFDVAVGQLEGRLSGEIKALRAKLMDLLVELTVNIDYPDEDIEIITYEKLEQGLTGVRQDIEKLLASFRTGKMLREGIAIAIIGRPNVGKSSLMNALLRESRAIVTDIPGTTRDTIEETMDLDGVPVRITDTAGIRDADNEIERVGIERSKDSFNKADLVLFMLDGSEKLRDEDRMIAKHLDPKKTIVILNKSDLEEQVTEEEASALAGEPLRILRTSLKGGDPTGALEQAVRDMVLEGAVSQGESATVTNARHEKLLRDALGSVNDALSLVEEKEPVEIIEIDVNQAHQSLGEIIGETASGEILDEVFSRFCLGK